IARRSRDYVEVVLVIIEIRMFPSQIVFDSTAAQVRAGDRVGNGAIARDHANVAGTIDKNAIAGEEIIAFIELGAEGLEKLLQLPDKIPPHIPHLPPHPRISTS